MQVRNKNVVYPASLYFVSLHLTLSRFTAINEKLIPFTADYLSRLMPVVHGKRRIISQNGYSKHDTELIFKIKLSFYFFHLNNVPCLRFGGSNVE